MNYGKISNIIEKLIYNFVCRSVEKHEFITKCLYRSGFYCADMIFIISVFVGITRAFVTIKRYKTKCTMCVDNTSLPPRYLNIFIYTTIFKIKLVLMYSKIHGIYSSAIDIFDIQTTYTYFLQ